jgi:N-acetylmuramoyl-L-alanine amidase CwlA
MKITQNFLTPSRFTRPQIKLQKITAVAVHYTGDPGATAQNEHDYFESLKNQKTAILNGAEVLVVNGVKTTNTARYASSHFVVGLNGEIIQLIPESEWAYCTNQANSYSLSIETCHPDSTGKFTAASEKSLIELAASLCKKYGLNPLSGGVIRHFDVTGKQCPLYYVAHPTAWEAFKTAVSNYMAGRAYTLPSYGTAMNSTVDPAFCDTTNPFSRKVGEVYQFKTGSDIWPGGAGVWERISQTVGSDGYFYTKFKAIGRGSAGFYMKVNGQDVRRTVGTVA